jgi:hypothetical protein
MSLSFGMLVIVVGGIIKRFDQDRVDVIFWLGFLFAACRGSDLELTHIWLVDIRIWLEISALDPSL